MDHFARSLVGAKSHYSVKFEFIISFKKNIAFSPHEEIDLAKISISKIVYPQSCFKQEIPQ